MKTAARTLTVALALVVLPAMAWAQGTDRSEMDQWVKDTQQQTEPPVGTTITMANWQQYKSVMPLGMIKLFQGTYGWKMPADVSIPVGPAHLGGNLPKTWRIGLLPTNLKLTNRHLPLLAVQPAPNSS